MDLNKLNIGLTVDSAGLVKLSKLSVLQFHKAKGVGKPFEPPCRINLHQN